MVIVEYKNNFFFFRPSRKVLQVNTITLSMSQFQSQREMAFNKRNKTTFSWYSQSLPNAASFNTLLNACQDTSSSQSSTKSGSKKQERPQSHNPYDGGVFTHPHSSKREYFVIHPDWVSEAMTIQKLSLTDRKVRSSTWPGRRCKSAPPPKFRNPITWQN